MWHRIPVCIWLQCTARSSCNISEAECHKIRTVAPNWSPTTVHLTVQYNIQRDYIIPEVLWPPKGTSTTCPNRLGFGWQPTYRGSTFVGFCCRRVKQSVWCTQRHCSVTILFSESPSLRQTFLSLPTHSAHYRSLRDAAILKFTFYLLTYLLT